MPDARIQVQREKEPLVVARGVIMDFPGVRALNAIDFELQAGEIHALLGENGAGKSTLIKIFSGMHAPTAGEILLHGKKLKLNSPIDAQRRGISTVFQEIDCLPQMSVADNICLGRQQTRFGLIDQKQLRERAHAALAKLDLKLDVSRTLGEYSVAIQQMVSIARALDIDSKVLILDEPTSSLDARESEDLFRVMGRLREQGIGIIFISHFLDHVYAISDRITVLRNGSKVGIWETRELSRPSLIEAMTGRIFERLQSLKDTEVTRKPEPLLKAHNLSRKNAITPLSLEVGRGESLGLAGLLGSGRTEVARLLFGADRPDTGSFSINGHQLKPGSVHSAISRGIAFTPEDRKMQGLILDLSVRENIVLAMQARRGALRPIPASEQNSLCDHYIKKLNIRTSSANTPVKTLSGGNQQKVLLARWLAIQPSLLILDDPTRGIDIGARAEIETLIDNLRRDGLSVIFISSELDELVRVCTRAIVMRDRRAVAELSGAQLTEANILSIIAKPQDASA